MFNLLNFNLKDKNLSSEKNKNFSNQKKKIKIRWLFLSITIPLAIFPILFLVIVSIRIIFYHLERQNYEFYSSLINQVSKNINLIYKQYAMTLSDITFIPTFMKLINPPDFKNFTEERIYFNNLEYGPNPTGGTIRRAVLSKIEGGFFIIVFDKFSFITQKRYIQYNFSDLNFEINAYNFKDEELYKKINQKKGTVFGMLSEKTLIGYEGNKRPVFILPYYEEQDKLKALLIAVLNPNVIYNNYINISKINLGTLYILDSANNIISTNHPSADDDYYYDEKEKTYIFNKGDAKYDPYNNMSFNDYKILITGQDILKKDEISKLLNSMQKEDFNYSKIYSIVYNKIKYLVVLNYSDITNTKFLFFLPVKHIYAPIYNLIYIIIVVGLIIIFLLNLIYIFISKYLTEPIVILSKVAYNNAKGIYTLANININNEVGELAENFNLMVTELNNIHNNLESIIEERTRDLLLAKKEAEEANKYKTRFLANMSHEIRTPMNAIFGITRLLEYGAFNKDDLIMAEIKKILDILDDFFKKVKFNNKNKNYILLKNMEKDYQLLYNNLYNGKNWKDFVLEKLKFYNDNIKNKEIKEKIEESYLNICSLKTGEEAEIARAYNQIKDSCTYLLDIVDRVLNIAKVEVGKIEVRKTEIDIRNFIQNIEFDIYNYLIAKNKKDVIIPIITIDQHLRHKIYFDKQLTKQVLLNLITNAIKFTPEGEIHINIYEEDNKIFFSIKDSGLGIKDDEKDKIFKEFGRTSVTAHIEGSGLGLIICKWFVEIQNGKIGFESEYGKGSRFWFYLPIE